MTRNSVVCSILVALAAGVATASVSAAADWPNIPTKGQVLGEPIGGPRWPALEFERRFPKPFAFEVGARYWFSTGHTSFGFTNGDQFFGDPTSTIDWNSMTGHSGEVFARVDHRPTNLFVKGLVGGGVLQGGKMVDRDLIAGQFTFSDTSSDVRGNNLSYAMVDVGYSWEIPRYGVRFGGFVGYHYWHEKMTANGVRCNPDNLGNMFCAPGTILSPFNVPSMIFQPTWQAARIGADASIRIDKRWTLTAEGAYVPYAHLENKDSHLLRQDPADLGPAPNIISTSKSGWGGTAQVLMNYAVLPNVDIGFGLRYWGLTTGTGSTRFGPTFNQSYELTHFDTQRYGILLQIKARL